MKIENLILLEFDRLSSSGKKYIKESFKFEQRDYVGYVSVDGATNAFKDAAAFVISNIRIENNKLIGDFNLANGPATELLTWIKNFEIHAVTLGSVNEDNEVYNAELISFVAEPIVEIA